MSEIKKIKEQLAKVVRKEKLNHTVCPSTNDNKQASEIVQCLSKLKESDRGKGKNKKAKRSGECEKNEG